MLLARRLLLWGEHTRQVVARIIVYVRPGQFIIQKELCARVHACVCARVCVCVRARARACE